MKLHNVAGYICILLFGSISTLPAATPGEHSQNFIPRVAFFGRSHGDGQSKFLLSAVKHFHVESNGYDLPDGSFRLDQTTTFQHQPPTKRFWVIEEKAVGQFTATLSDAFGPVSGFGKGSELELSYRVRAIFVLHQRLQLQADGKTIDNVGRVTLLGIPVGTIYETIVRD